MFDDRDFHVDAALLQSRDRRRRGTSPERTPPIGEQELIEDLELSTIWDAMALGNELLYASARTAIGDPLLSVEQIRYRQAVLTDCLAQPAIVRQIYALAVQAIDDKAKIWGQLSTGGSTRLHHAISVLEVFLPILKQLRTLTTERSGQFRSPGFTRFFATLRRELDDAYFDEIEYHLHELRFGSGVLMSARLGEGNQGVDYVLRHPSPQNRSRFFSWRPALKKPIYSHTVPPRDEAGATAMGRLRDRGVSLVADALGQSTDHILSFFSVLRDELGFYVSALNLHEQLGDMGVATCLPDPQPLGSSVWSARALTDSGLTLRLKHRAESNDLNANDKKLLILTGANQGGKSTFLRSIGVAQLMMQAGLFVGAESFAATITPRVFSHYKREEDATMTRGKFDEELARMNKIVGAIECGCLLLCNESFSATNEREGSQISDEFLRAMNEIGVRVVFVTHLYELAHLYYQQHTDSALFLRAERDCGGERSFRIVEAEPLPTSYGEDLYWQTFGRAPPADS